MLKGDSRMNELNIYEAPELSIIMLSCDDIIATSNDFGEDFEGEGGGDFDIDW